MDHDTFHSLELDALYQELDAHAAAELSAHAAACETCGPRFEQLQRTRQRGLAALRETVSDGFESRVMAAVDAALAQRAVVPLPVPLPLSQGSASGGAKVIPLFARPSFQVAATLLLLIGAAGVLSQTSMGRKSAPAAMNDQGPAVVAAEAPASPPSENATPAPTTLAMQDTPAASGAFGAVAAAPLAVTVDESDGKLALNERLKSREGPSPPSAAAKPMMSPPAMRALGNASDPSSGLGGSGSDPAFASAKRLFSAGRYADALPKFEGMKTRIPEAELYAARCIRQTRGCAAAAPRFDQAAQHNSGSAVGSRAQLEAGQCYEQMNQAQAARSRYQAAKDEGILATEAAGDLDALDNKPTAPMAAAPAATSTAGTPGAGHAMPSPKAPARPAAAPMIDDKK